MITLDLNPQERLQQSLQADSLLVRLPERPVRFYRHGWQSWTLTSWVDPLEPMSPIAAHQTRAKDEDPPYAFSDHPVSAWVGAVELAGGNVLLAGALELSGRVEIRDRQLHCFYEDGHAGKWVLFSGDEQSVFQAYARDLSRLYGPAKPNPPRVWCSWYSLYNSINESIIHQVIQELGDLPFDVVQLDDGWQISLGEWEANAKFPSGMEALADKIRASGRTAGIWISPFVTALNSKFAHTHPDWLLRNDEGRPVYAGIGWSGELAALDSSHPEVLEWLDTTIRRLIRWGYRYLKMDFLYAAALPGRRKGGLGREDAFRQALQVIRATAGDETYLLACGAPVLPVLGICDGIRIGPDVAPFWLSKPMSLWVNNPNNPGTQNAIRTSLHRLWLVDLIQIDPDVVYFRTRHNRMTRVQTQLLQDLVRLTGFKASSDLPRWLDPGERDALRDFLREPPEIKQISRYRYEIGGRTVDFSAVMPLPQPVRFPAQIALLIGILQSGIFELLPGWIESQRAKWKRPSG